MVYKLKQQNQVNQASTKLLNKITDQKQEIVKKDKEISLLMAKDQHKTR